MLRISPDEVAQAFETRRRLRPSVVHPVSAEEIRMRVQRVLFWRPAGGRADASA